MRNEKNKTKTKRGIFPFDHFSSVVWSYLEMSKTQTKGRHSDFWGASDDFVCLIRLFLLGGGEGSG